MSADKEYKCSIEIKFPTDLHAQHAMEVLSVDQEIGDRVIKTLCAKGSALVV
jgi:hypothetical protein